MKGTATKSSRPFLHEKTFKNSLESFGQKYFSVYCSEIAENFCRFLVELLKEIFSLFLFRKERA